jgi:hypothetical protein
LKAGEVDVAVISAPIAIFPAALSPAMFSRIRTS